MTTFHVTVWNHLLTGRSFSRSIRPCGQPTTRGRLCAWHESERVRLGGRS